jgi:hypothetical protein
MTIFRVPQGYQFVIEAPGDWTRQTNLLTPVNRIRDPDCTQLYLHIPWRNMSANNMASYSLTKPNLASIFAFWTRGNLLYAFVTFQQILIFSTHTHFCMIRPSPICMRLVERYYSLSSTTATSSNGNPTHQSCSRRLSFGVSKSLCRILQHLLRPFSWPRKQNSQGTSAHPAVGFEPTISEKI